MNEPQVGFGHGAASRDCGRSRTRSPIPTYFLLLPMRGTAAAPAVGRTARNRSGAALSFYRPRPRRRPRRRASPGSTSCCRRRHRATPPARSGCMLPARARLRLQAGELLVLPPRRRHAARHRGRSQQHLRRAPLLPAAGPHRPAALDCRRGKVFHVSPFCAVEGRYRFRFMLTGARPRHRATPWRASTTTTTHGPLLQTSVSGTLQPLTAASTARAPSSASPLHDARRHRAHPLAGAAAWPQARALPQRPPPALRALHHTMTSTRHQHHLRARLGRRPRHRRAARAHADTPAARRARRCSCPTAAAPRFGSGEPDRRRITLHNWNVFARRAQVRRHRLCRELHRRRLEHARPDRTADAVDRQPRRSRSARLRHLVGPLLYRAAAPAQPQHARAAAASNIHAHYDLGNAFYRLWLDATMNYSTAPGSTATRARRWPQAQHAKVRRALAWPRVQRRRRACWKSAAAGARLPRSRRASSARTSPASRCRTEQLAYARHAHAPARAWPTRADLRLQDYRDDRRRRRSTRSARSRCSRPWAALLAHATSPPCAAAQARRTRLHPDHRDRRRRCSTATSAHRLHPAVHLPRRLPALPARVRSAGRGGRPGGGRRQLAFGADYAETLRRWRDGLPGAPRAEVRALGFDERFMRIWEFYLAYCEAAFAQRNTDVVQYTLRKR